MARWLLLLIKKKQNKLNFSPLTEPDKRVTEAEELARAS
jgi:hypothetical protein